MSKMKPMKLQLIAFGPYLNETIDFTSFYKNSIFLIAGKTGAGKTTIFDAMSYALFGFTNGLNREPKEMRSTFAGPSDETKVLFTFSAQNKVYQVERIPEQILAKKRGEGVRVVKAKAAVTVFDETGQELTHFSKTTEVNQLIQEVVQLEAEQFRQIIMLPQGDFRRFLNANSNEKEKILRKLFGTEPYRIFSEKLKEQKKQVTMQLKDQEKELRTTLNHAQWEVELPEIVETGQARIQKELEWLSAQQTKKIEELAELNIAIQKMQETERAYQKEFDTKKGLVELFEEKERVAKEYQALNETASTIQQLRGNIQQIKEAEKILPHFNRKEDLVQEQQSIIAELDKLKQEEVVQTEKLEKQKELLATLTAEKAQQTKRETDLIQLKQQAGLIEKLQENQQKEQQIMETMMKYEKQKVTQELETNKVLLEMETLTRQLNEQQELMQEINQLKTQQMVGEISGKLLLEQLELEANLIVAKRQLSELSIEIDAQEQAICAYEAHYKTAKSNWAKVQIMRLAKELEEGMPCPVCGSLEHPDVHIGEENENQATVAELEAQLEATEMQLTKAKSTLASLVSHKEFSEKQVEKEEKKAAVQKDNCLKDTLILNLAGDSFSEKATELKAKQAEISQSLLEKQEKRIEETVLAHQLERLNEAAKIARVAVEASQQKITMLQQEQAINKGELLQLKEQIPEKLLVAGAYSEQVTELETAISVWQQQFQEAETRTRTIENQLEHIQYQKEQLIKQQAKIKRQLTQIKEEIDLLIEASDFATEAEVSTALTKAASVPNWEDQVMHFDKEEYRLGQRLTELKERLADIEKPELSVLTETLDKLRLEKENLQHTAIKEEQIFNQNNQVLSEATEITASIQEQWALLTEISNLAAVASGDSDQSKMGFERYVLTYFLEEVLMVANERLQKLSNNRYLFDLNREEGSRKTDTGLEINIYDDNAGGMRNVRTLSGGESFIAALSLSLSLSEVVQQYAGGIQIDTMFIDEGFGSLDEDALEEAMDALLQIEGTGRLLGIISHVKELKERIPDKLLVISSGTGKSQIKISHVDE